jgi:hypothetical protein
MIGLMWSIFYLVNSGQASFNNQVEDYLVSVIDSNEERIGDVFDELERDVLFLAESDKVKEILKKDIGESEAAAKFDVDGKVFIVARETENYIRSHPDMTIDDLRQNLEFDSIIVQNIGSIGYSMAYGAEDREILFHKNPEFIGMGTNAFNENSPGLFEISEAAIIKGSSFGFYDWKDPDGKIRRKYAEFRKISSKTADGINLISGTTAYVDDYLVAQNVGNSLDNYFVEFEEARDYHNILFISKDNRIVYMVGTKDGLGSNLENVVNGFGEIVSVINKLEGKNIGFYGPFLGHLSDVYLQFAMASRVYDGEEFLGTLVIIDEMDSVNEILFNEEDIQSREFDEDYLVNGDGLLITPLRGRNVDVMVQEVRTESVEGCLEELAAAIKRNISSEEYHIIKQREEREDVFPPFLNFNGDLTFGLHRPIDKVGWCILSEVDAKSVLDKPMEKSFRSQIGFRLWVMFFVVLLVIMISFFIDKRYILVKKREIFRENFFTRLSLRYYLLFAFVFAAAYLFIVTLYFQGIQNAKLFDDIPDMLVFVVGIMVFAVGLKIKDVKVRYFIIYGGLLICLRRLLDIPLQEYQILSGITPVILWIPVIIFEFIGLLLLLVGYRRLKNG